MTKEEHEKLSASFKAITEVLNDKTLSPEKRKEFETLKAQLAGALMSSWLPADSIRKVIMALVAIATIYFFVQSSYIVAVILLIILCMFSPRLVGEVAVFIGRAKGN